MLEFALGFMVCAWVALLLGGVYAFWRYAYRPFQSVTVTFEAFKQALETEIAERKNEISNLHAEIGLRKALVLDDAAVARGEARQRARQDWTSFVAP